MVCTMNLGPMKVKMIKPNGWDFLDVFLKIKIYEDLRSANEGLRVLTLIKKMNTPINNFGPTKKAKRSG